jgi:hypothetical protein
MSKLDRSPTGRRPVARQVLACLTLPALPLGTGVAISLILSGRLLYGLVAIVAGLTIALAGIIWWA